MLVVISLKYKEINLHFICDWNEVPMEIRRLKSGGPHRARARRRRSPMFWDRLLSGAAWVGWLGYADSGLGAEFKACRLSAPTPSALWLPGKPRPLRTMSEGHKTFEMMGNYADGVVKPIVER